MEWDIKYKHITKVFFFFFFTYVHTLVINKSYSNEKLQGMNKLSQITNEYMNPIPWDNLSN